MAKVEVVSSKKENQTTTLNNEQVNNVDNAAESGIDISYLILIGFLIWCAYWFLGGAEKSSLRNRAESAAISNLAGDYLSSSEISCKYNSTSGDIIIVKCTTTNDILIESFDSDIIWFGYLPSASGNKYRYSVGNNKTEVISELN